MASHKDESIEDDMSTQDSTSEDNETKPELTSSSSTITEEKTAVDILTENEEEQDLKQEEEPESELKTIQIESHDEASNTSNPLTTLDSVEKIDHFQTELIKKEIPTNRVSLNRDIYNVYVILKAYGNWNKLSRCDQILFIILMCFCASVQLGLLLLLTFQMDMNPPWKEFEPGAGSSDMEIYIKIMTVLCITIYISREISNDFQLRYCIINVKQFSDAIGTYQWSLRVYFAVATYLLALSLSVALIATASTGLYRCFLISDYKYLLLNLEILYLVQQIFHCVL